MAGVDRKLDPARFQKKRNRLIKIGGQVNNEARELVKELSQEYSDHGLEGDVCECYNKSAIAYHLYKIGDTIGALSALDFILDTEIKILLERPLHSIFGHYCQTLINLSKLERTGFSNKTRIPFASNYALNSEIVDSFSYWIYEELIFECLKNDINDIDDFIFGFNDLPLEDRLIVLLCRPAGLGSLYKAVQICRAEGATDLSKVTLAIENRLHNLGLYEEVATHLELR